ncbi:MAG: hypothetical protein M1839_004929 [Geoglossum umbratile]|nr:MAG: hypothetical protein M1839_004929 [Geoglossum umbratile]
MSFFMRGIVEYKTLSPKVFSALKKNGVINPTTGVLDTTKITKYFLHQVAVLSKYKQRRLIGMLFFWEEELMRWRLLEEEEVDIKEAIVHEGEREDLIVALRVIQAKKRMEPSVRGQSHTLPEYS